MTKKVPRADMDPEALKRMRKREYDLSIKRAQGEGGLVPNTRVQKRIRFLIDEKGVAGSYIAKRAGVSEAMVMGHYHGLRRTGGETRAYGSPLETCRWDFERAILGAKFTHDDVFQVDACGVHRRIGALIHHGYTYSFLAAQMGQSLAVFHRRLVTDKRERSRYSFHRQLDALYSKLIAMDPADAGVGEHGRKYAARLAEKHGFAPAHCWDEDTIDDPNAFPEWTGECGTVTGYFLHLKYGIRVKEWSNGTRPGGEPKIKKSVQCDACKDARLAAKAKYTKWNDADRASILSKIDNGWTVRAVAAEYGCSTRTVERFKRERRDGRQER